MVSLSLSFFNCKMGMVIIGRVQGCFGSRFACKFCHLTQESGNAGSSPSQELSLSLLGLGSPSVSWESELLPFVLWGTEGRRHQVRRCR